MRLATRGVCSRLALVAPLCALALGCGEAGSPSRDARADGPATEEGGARPDAATGSDGGAVPDGGAAPDASTDPEGGVALDGDLALDGGVSPDGLVAADDAADASPASASCYPFDQPSTSALRASPKKVFGFYYPVFPISIDNADPASDFWTRWLSPDGGGGEYASIGGLMRDRPLPRPPWPGTDWRQRDFETEVRRAIAVGLDGFLYEYPDHVSSDARQNQLPTMLAAALAVDPQFKIVLSPDFPTTAGATTDGLVATIAAVASHPSLYRLADGSIVLASFAPERQPVSFWTTLRDRLAAMGIRVAFWPLLNPVAPSTTVDASWNPLVDAFSSWGGRTVSSADQWRQWSLEAHRRGKRWMSPVAFEDTRNKADSRWYAESSNSGALRAQFEAAIAGDADAVALLTWTDYTESWMSASQERGFVISDLVAYYTTWFKTGARPAIARDALYYFHRDQHTDAPYDTSRQTAGPMVVRNSGPAENMVELLAFLASPGQLAITQGSDARTMDAPAGMTSFRVPLVPGTTPVFELRRGGAAVQHVVSHTPIRSQVIYQDMMYHAGGGLACTRPG